MKRMLLSLLVTLTWVGAWAQGAIDIDSVATDVVVSPIDMAIEQYDFANAELLLNKEIAQLRKQRQSTMAQEDRLEWLRRAQMKLNAVEKVTFVDSLIVPRDQVLSHIRLSPECGTLHTFKDFFQKDDEMDCTVFLSQMGDQFFYANPDADNHLHLYKRELYSDNTVSNPVRLAGISDNENESQNYPYMMADGATIYFAAQNAESLGGYDIFMSRYDADEHRFLTPENIGMPFNSPANDYLYVIDDFNNLGWFVTDRNMPADKVCIYVFIPNETRQVYAPEETAPELLRGLAKISSIRETWNNEGEVKTALFRLREARAAQRDASGTDFDFVVTDNRIYHRQSDFQTSTAQKDFETWKQAREELRKVQTTLTQLRTRYHTGTQSEREQLKGDILMLENSEGVLTSQIRQLEKNMRRAELGM